MGYITWLIQSADLVPRIDSEEVKAEMNEAFVFSFFSVPKERVGDER